MKTCCFIIPYFGKFPNYFPLFLKTCSWNKNFSWLVITDIETRYDYPDNFRVVKMTFAQLKELIQSKFDFQIAVDSPYKLCDYKPAYGYIFEEYLQGVDFWGHCDVDTLMGDLSAFITQELLEKYEKIFCIGHMVLYRNTFKNNRVFMSTYKGAELYKRVFSTNDICWFDEEYKNDHNINEIFISQNKKVFTTDYSLNLRILPTKFVRSRYLGLQNCKENHGYKVEKYRRAIYTWEKGHVYRYYILDGQIKREEFLYAHFLRRKMELDQRVIGLDIFKIIPNKFLPLECYPISLDNFWKIKNSSLTLHYFRVKIQPKLKKLRKQFQVNF